MQSYPNVSKFYIVSLLKLLIICIGGKKEEEEEEERRRYSFFISSVGLPRWPGVNSNSSDRPVWNLNMHPVPTLSVALAKRISSLPALD